MWGRWENKKHLFWLPNQNISGTDFYILKYTRGELKHLEFSNLEVALELKQYQIIGIARIG